MDRFGRPRFRGAVPAAKPFGTRPAPSPRSGLLGAGPRPQNQYGSYQGNQSQDWKQSRSGSGGPMPGPNQKRGPPQYDNGGYRGGSNQSSGQAPGNQSWRQDNKSSSVPSDVEQLMQTFDLSESDMQKLSQLPENELSVSNLARVIGNLRQEKEQNVRPRPTSYMQRQGDSQNTNQSPSFNRGQRGSYTDNNSSYSGRKDGSLLGVYPNQRNPYPPTSRPGQYGSDRPGPGTYSNSGSRPTGIKVTVKPAGPPPGRPGYMNDRQDYRRDDRDDYYRDRQGYGRGSSPDRYDQPRNDSYSQNNRRFNDRNINEREAKQGGYNDDRRERDRPPPQAPRGVLPRPVGTRNIQNKPAGNMPPLLQAPASSGLLGNPLQPNAQGLENLVAAVGGNAASQAATLLNPLVIASQTDPNVLEAQIQAMKAIQAQAIKMKQQTPYYDGPGPNREKERPRRRSPPPPRGNVGGQGSGIDRRLEEDARKEAQEMRTMHGRVLYIRFKSPRVLEQDLRQLASAFGRVTKLLLIKPKIPNGHFQAFMEMEQFDCAAAMLERYMARSPNIKGCPIEVQRSNYRDLQIRSDQMKDRGNKRLRSISPIRKGTTQLPKRDRKGIDKPALSITTSKSDRRVVTRSNDDKKRDRRSRSSEKEREPSVDDDKKTDAREILNRTRSSKAKDGDRKDSDSKDASRRRRSRYPGDRSSEEPKEKSQRVSSEKEDSQEDDADVKKEEESGDVKEETVKDGSVEEGGESEDGAKTSEETDVEKSKEDIDPLDEIADELALHDEFVLMDEVGYEGDQKKSEDDHLRKDASDAESKEAKEEKKTIDLQREDLDLENVDVDTNQVENGNKDAESEVCEGEEQVEENKEEDGAKQEDAKDEELKNEEESNQENEDKTEDVEPKNEDVQKEEENVDEKELATPVEEDKPPADDPSQDIQTDVDATEQPEEKKDDTETEEKEIKTDQSMVINDEETSNQMEQKEEEKADTTDAGNTSIIEDQANVEKQDQEDTVDEENPEASPDAPEEQAEEDNLQENKITELQSIIADTLHEVAAAKAHLESLMKVTKARAAQAFGKKLKVCLDVAVTRLESANS